MDQLDYPYEIVINTVSNGGSGGGGEQQFFQKEIYSMVAMCVHSGSSLHYGHYYSYVTYQAEWLLANDSQLSETTFESLMANLNLFKDDTPYVLFYKRVNENSNKMDMDVVVEDTSSIGALQTTTANFEIKNKKLIDAIQQDNQICEMEKRTRLMKRQQKRTNANSTKIGPSKNSNRKKDNDDDDDDNNGSSRLSQLSNFYDDSQRDSGPRVIF